MCGEGAAAALLSWSACGSVSVNSSALRFHIDIICAVLLVNYKDPA